MITTDFLGLLDRFNLIMKKKVTSSYSGSRRSVAYGKGSTLLDHRIYAYGDDFRLIDWKVYARTDNLYIKRYEEERNLTAHIIVDNSNSMNYGKPSKFDYAAMLGVGFAYLALKENERFQFSTFSDALEIFQPKRGVSHLASMIDYLNHAKAKGKSAFLDAISQYKKLLTTRSLIVLISDFLFDIYEIQSALFALGKHNLMIIQVLDKSEKELDFSGDLRLQDSETKQELRTFISPRLTQEYLLNLQKHKAAIEEACLRLNAKYFQITTDTPVFDAFYGMLR